MVSHFSVQSCFTFMQGSCITLKKRFFWVKHTYGFLLEGDLPSSWILVASVSASVSIWTDLSWAQAPWTLQSHWDLVHHRYFLCITDCITDCITVISQWKISAFHMAASHTGETDLIMHCLILLEQTCWLACTSKHTEEAPSEMSS